ncbi:hypothetical protein DPMN_066226 [Dreissena polymorpha]|uniref:Uncharacterized protein n=1 Tax=Dreissena polymorpha TaxID=45954 RepID=A0A9D3YXE1_DREPO|nr:hypothetical protein DPMN_066226 [Dreissena polymorpha]
MSIIEDEMKTLKDEGDKIFKQTGGTYVSAVPKQSVADRNESRRVESESIFTVIFKLLREVFRMLKATPKSADVDEKLQRLDNFESKARNARKKLSEIQDKIDEKQK